MDLPHAKVLVSGKAWREGQNKAQAYWRNFLRGLEPERPLFNTPEARVALGEPVDRSPITNHQSPITNHQSPIADSR
jgi:hypothetical protein